MERVEIKDVKLPVQLQRAMAAEAEAAREARAKVIKRVILYPSVWVAFTQSLTQRAAPNPPPNFLGINKPALGQSLWDLALGLLLTQQFSECTLPTTAATTKAHMLIRSYR